MDSVLTADWGLLIISLMALGGVSGFFAGLLGIGGGTILVPGLYYLFSILGYDGGSLMHVAVGTSLAIIVPTAISSAGAHLRRGAVDLRVFKHIGVGIFIGALLGAMMADGMSSETLKLIFAATSVILAIIMIGDPSRRLSLPRLLRQPMMSAAGIFMGVIASLMGIGAAVMTVPYMSMGGVDIRRAIGTAAALGLSVSIPATIGYVIGGWNVATLPPLSFGYVNLAAWFLVMFMSTLIAPLGAATAHRVDVNVMRRGFALFMVMVAIKMSVDVLS